MAKGDKRYWVYSHDDSGDLVNDLGEEWELRDAVDTAAHYLRGLFPHTAGVTVRVVDQQADSTTVWIAGPGNRILTSKQAQEYEDEDRHSVQA